jgi:nanoRNase/pAp phosphatase (c-di-AMP/oligoRNAs hydrolase)
LCSKKGITALPGITWDRVQKFIEQYDSFLITTHINPDGDAIGSEAALKAFLDDLDKTAAIINSNATPDNLAFLDPENEIKVFPQDVDKTFIDDFDVAFILDVNNWDHLGALGKALASSSMRRVCIDHHQGADDDFADVVISDTGEAATGMLVYDLIRSMGATISKRIADAVYSTIISDTGTFRFSNTGPRAFAMAAEMCQYGADPFTLHRLVFGNKSWGTGRLLGPVLSTIQTDAGGRLAWIHATQKMMNEARATYDDSDGFVDLVRVIKGVELVLFFKELPDGKIKVSLRSNGKVDAFAIAESFSGGGHRMASGMKLDGPLEKAIETAVRVCLQVDGVKATDGAETPD